MANWRAKNSTLSIGRVSTVMVGLLLIAAAACSPSELATQCDGVAAHSAPDISLLDYSFQGDIGVRSINGPQPPLGELIDVSLEATNEVVCGEAVPLMLSLRNVTGNVLTLAIASDFESHEVFEEQGEKIWNWQPDDDAPDYVFGIQIEPGEVLTLRRSWLLEDINQNPIHTGTYHAQSMIKAIVVEYDSQTETEASSNIVSITVSQPATD